ncbi:MAG: GGDEF domain-containing protein [Gammaproteobacteria bacterium]|nr:MAG: GGDEF domain-containing protein [Gammaproteobacteria bacterium]
MNLQLMPESRRFGLSFRDGGLEQAFQAYYAEQYLGFSRLGVLVGFVLFLVFGVLDRYLYPEVYSTLWFLRYAVASPLFLLLIVVLFFVQETRHSQPLLAAMAIVVGLSVVGMIHEIPVQRDNPYYAGLMLVIFYSHGLVRMQFRWATLSSIIIVLAYEAVVLILRTATSFEEILAGNFFFISAALTGMGTSLIMEYDARRQFLLQRHLAEERNLLEQANRKLNAINARLDAEAHVDELTRIPNRRSFFEHLDREWRRQLRRGEKARPVSLLLIDIDFFKRYNDHYGHPAGDRCLKRIAGLIAQAAQRPGDLAARIGGEEFVLLLPETDLEAARDLAEALRDRVEQEAIPHRESPIDHHVTISIGVASLIPGGNVPPSELVHGADHALYEAKRAGRNLVATLEARLG